MTTQPAKRTEHGSSHYPHYPHYPLYYHKTRLIRLEDLPHPYPHLVGPSSPTTPPHPPKTLADSIRHPQLYIPIYQRFFELTPQNHQQIALNHRYHIRTLEQVIDTHSPRASESVSTPVFIKYSPLLDPIKYMVGKYDLSDPATKRLPTLQSTEQTTHPKILTPSNASYIDGFFYYLSSVLKNHHHFVHGIDFYGSYLGIQDHFKVNIEEDLEYLSNSPFFVNNIGKLMVLEHFNQDTLPFTATGSRRHRPQVAIQDQELDPTQLDLGIIDLDVVNPPPPTEPTPTTTEPIPIPTPLNMVYSKSDPEDPEDPEDNSQPSPEGSETDETDESDESEDSRSEHTDDDEDQDDPLQDPDQDPDQEDDADDDWETESETSDIPTDSDQEATAYIHDFPVQMIFLEECHSTMDELLVTGLPPDEVGAALFQIIMILLVYQRVFKFTHNDLHTNNIMYIHTEQPFLYYQYQQTTYRVPTYGRIFKIIDYGRSIYRYHQMVFCSDSFAPGGDAATQYNCEPFFKSSKPRLEPNMSFDLCRLGCSIYDFLFDDHDHEGTVTNDLQRTIKRWCTDDEGKNILYKRNGSERYPGFKLYKMIARTVHQHTPEAQLQDPWFQRFIVPTPDHPTPDHPTPGHPTTDPTTTEPHPPIMCIETYPEYDTTVVV